jgi:hypothetical protein
MKYISTFSFFLIAAGAWLAVENTVENAFRCDGSGYDGGRAFEEGLFSAFPSIMLLMFLLLSQLSKVLKFNILIANILYFYLMLNSYMHDRIINYAPCDRKGDESSLGNFFFGLLAVEVFAFLSILCGLFYFTICIVKKH